MLMLLTLFFRTIASHLCRFRENTVLRETVAFRHELASLSVIPLVKTAAVEHPTEEGKRRPIIERVLKAVRIVYAAPRYSILDSSIFGSCCHSFQTPFRRTGKPAYSMPFA